MNLCCVLTALSSTMPFSAFHSIELQLIMQCCDQFTLLSLARCCRFTLATARHPFAWACSKPMSLHCDSMLQPSELIGRLSSSLLRCAPMHLTLHLSSSGAEQAQLMAAVGALPRLVSFQLQRCGSARAGAGSTFQSHQLYGEAGTALLAGTFVGSVSIRALGLVNQFIGIDPQLQLTRCDRPFAWTVRPSGKRGGSTIRCTMEQQTLQWRVNTLMNDRVELQSVADSQLADQWSTFVFAKHPHGCWSLRRASGHLLCAEPPQHSSHVLVADRVYAQAWEEFEIELMREDP